jgi:UDPglucose 6-dehydrogenase
MPLRLSVIGTGYLGATHAACMAELGFEVIGFDVDEAKIDALRAGRVPFFEPDLPELIAKHVTSGRLRFTTDLTEVITGADVHFICVGTPQKPGSFAADLTYVWDALEALGTQLGDRPALVVGKSTVPIGTAADLADRLAILAPTAELAWNPEFLREGYAVDDTLRPERLVIGTRSAHAEKILRDVYAPITDTGIPLIVADFATAELVKVAANSFLATKISFINAMAEICETTGADVTLLAQALALDTRIGGRFLHAGLGFGGGCLPKDIRAFIARAEELGVDQAVAFLRDVDAINTRRRQRMVDLARELCNDTFTGRHVTVLGAAFKPNSDDVRDSPALHVAQTIHDQGAHVTLYDPQAMTNAKKLHPNLHYATTATQAATGADVVLHLTEWREFRDMDPHTLTPVVTHPRIVDGRNALDPTRWRDAGWTYRALGRP